MITTVTDVNLLSCLCMVCLDIIRIVHLLITLRANSFVEKFWFMLCVNMCSYLFLVCGILFNFIFKLQIIIIANYSVTESLLKWCF